MSDTRSLPSATEQARTFSRVRDAHTRELTEDYVELIADLIDGKGEARAADLAERFGVTAATVNNMTRRLERDGYVTSPPYRSIFLTTSGRELAEKCRARHELVRDFLIALGVDRKIADRDAEGIEHHVSAETLEAFRRFVEQSGD